MIQQLQSFQDGVARAGCALHIRLEVIVVAGNLLPPVADRRISPCEIERLDDFLVKYEQGDMCPLAIHFEKMPCQPKAQRKQR